LRPVSEFFDYQRISRPADVNQATSVSSDIRDERKKKLNDGLSFLVVTENIV